MSSNEREIKKPRLEQAETESASFFKAGRPICQFGVNCYRKNPHHFKEIQHAELEKLYTQIIHAQDSVENYSKYQNAAQFPKNDDLLQQLKILRGFGFGKSSTSASSDSDIEIIASIKKMQSQQRQDMLTKWNNSLPFNFFLTSISTDDDTHYSIGFRDLFDPSLGPVKAVCHFNFMIEFEWVREHTVAAGLEGKPMTLLFGNGTPELNSASKIFPWVTTQLIKSPFPFGHHHTKLTLIKYDDDSLRFIFSTANLIESDWEKRTQGVWIGPRCPATITPGSSGESSTNFRRDLVQYLSSYPSRHVAPWIAAIRNCDCSQIKVAFVGSAPVTLATSTNGFEWGHKKVEKLLKESGRKIETTWPLIMQCSSIGTLGANDDWLRHEIGGSMTTSATSASVSPLSVNKTPMHVIFPSHQNVLDSFDGIYGGGCLPYSFTTHQKQTWFRSYLHHWKSDLVGRSRAVPHIKSYCRISPDSTRIAWFLLTSANLSKAAWGKLNKACSKLSVMSWEAGVLFLPKYFDCDTFQVAKSADAPVPTNAQPPAFRLPYDVPVTKYVDGVDRPWIIEALQALGGSCESD